MSTDPTASGNTVEDLLDALVAEFSDRLQAGERPDLAGFLARAPAEARPGLERCLRAVAAGLERAAGPHTPLAAGLRFGRYELVREIGRGGMALVWLARDSELRRAVALKVLRPGLATEASHRDRFAREAKAAAGLQHPHVVQVFEVGESHGYLWLAMEHVEGPTLASVIEALATLTRPTAEDLARLVGVPALAEPGQPVEQLAGRLLAPVADALATAHAAGLVHRDVKPSNLLVQRDGRVVVADFGLAKSDSDPALSMTGQTLGTPYYMSPEQAYLTGRVVDHRTDVYSLGVTLYELLSCRRPYGGSSFLEVIESIRSTSPPALRAIAPARSKDAQAIARRAMERDPDRRYATASEFAADLRALAEGSGTRALTEEGNWLRRTQTQVRLFASGQPYEYKSQGRLLGLPLVHIANGATMPGRRRRSARGWFALGPSALGFFAMGGRAAGVVAFGGMASGLVFACGGLTAGLTAFGGLAIGGVLFSGFGLGWFVYGGVAVGYYAIGGIARGYFAEGGNAVGRNIDPDLDHGLATPLLRLLWSEHF